MKAKKPPKKNGMKPEDDFDYAGAVRGKYYKRLLKEGANVIVLDPDIARVFRSSEAVNDALRSLLKVSKAAQRAAGKASPRARSRRS